MPTYYNEAEIQMMIDEFGMSVTIAGVTAKGIVDRVDEEAVAGFASHALGKLIAVTVKTGTFPALVTGVAVVVEGANYKAREVMQIGDGALTKFMCAVEE